MNTLRQRFSVTLVVNHACNLRCSYCYTGGKFSAPMPWETGTAAIRRALRSLQPEGLLDLGFFGGEPLLESGRILDWMLFSRTHARECGRRVRFNLTTNGTVTHREAWQIMMAEDLELSVSFDGSPTVHDRHRRDVHGRGTADRVETTLRQLIQSGKDLYVIVVVRPDTLAEIPEGLRHLHNLEARSVILSLDLWTVWTAADGVRLRELVFRASELWRSWLPTFSLNWFDAKAAQLARLPMTEETNRCGFGSGEIAVAPSGRLYPCERLVGEDRLDHPLRLPGHALDGEDFADCAPAKFEPCTACARCILSTACDTTCRCSNFVRTGDINCPDGLLCLLNQATSRAVIETLADHVSIPLPDQKDLHNERPCYAQ